MQSCTFEYEEKVQFRTYEEDRKLLEQFVDVSADGYVLNIFEKQIDSLGISAENVKVFAESLNADNQKIKEYWSQNKADFNILIGREQYIFIDNKEGVFETFGIEKENPVNDDVTLRSTGKTFRGSINSPVNGGGVCDFQGGPTVYMDFQMNSNGQGPYSIYISCHTGKLASDKSTSYAYTARSGSVINGTMMLWNNSQNINKSGWYDWYFTANSDYCNAFIDFYDYGYIPTPPPPKFIPTIDDLIDITPRPNIPPILILK
jgi:hypothetical protein